MLDAEAQSVLILSTLFLICLGLAFLPVEVIVEEYGEEELMED